jgi:hypothetical protein
VAKGVLLDQILRYGTFTCSDSACETNNHRANNNNKKQNNKKNLTSANVDFYVFE